MSTVKRSIGDMFGVLCVVVALVVGLAAILLSVASASAVAAPFFEVELERDQATVYRNDERVDYTVKVKNVAPPEPAVGDELVCDGTLPFETWCGTWWIVRP